MWWLRPRTAYPSGPSLEAKSLNGLSQQEPSRAGRFVDNPRGGNFEGLPNTRNEL